MALNRTKLNSRTLLLLLPGFYSPIQQHRLNYASPPDPIRRYFFSVSNPQCLQILLNIGIDSGFLTVSFYGVGLLAPRPTLNLEDQGSVFITPRDTGAQLYPLALGTHFGRLLRPV
jgi:hypothetical protein